MTMKKIHFYTHIGTQLLAHQLAVCSCLLFYLQGNSQSLIWKMSKLLINIICWFNEMQVLCKFSNVWTIKSFHFLSILIPVKLLTKYSKHLPSLSNTLIKCFINPSLISKRGNIIMSLETRGLSITSLSPGFNSVSRASLCWHNVDSELYCPISRENMEILCIKTVDPVESLPFESPHRSPNYDLGIWSILSLVLLDHTFLLKLLNA